VSPAPAAPRERPEALEPAGPPVPATSSSPSSAAAAPVSPPQPSLAASGTKISFWFGPRFGALTEDHMRAAFESLSPTILACYDAHHDGDPLANLGIQVEVRRTGEVIGAGFTGYGGITHVGFTCVREAVLAHRFPPIDAYSTGLVIVHLERKPRAAAP
jgi:hypothetical protein